MRAKFAEKSYYIFLIFIILLMVSLITSLARASVLDDLKQSIDQKNAEIKQLEEDAKKFRAELATKQEMGKNLKQELNRIQTNIKKLQNDISITQQQIKRAELEITALSYEIDDKEQSIQKLRGGLANLLSAFYETQQNTRIELFFRQPTFSRFFQMLNGNAIIQKKVLATLVNLHALKSDLEGEKNAQEEKRNESNDLNKLLQQRQHALVFEKKEQTQVLSITQQQEKLYQQLLAEQAKKRQQLDREIEDIEAKIRITIDASSLPKQGSGVLGWPLSDFSPHSCFSSVKATLNCVTQFFGYTDFAAVGGYAGKGHNGVDLRANVGTSLYAAGDGVVTDIGDTDIGCRGASYGKWILISHPNNLSTLYAHLSQVSVSKGEQIKRDSRIGLTGKSGYATGPHLHMGLFATQGVQVQELRSKVCGRMMTLPIAAVNAYLNPLDYL